MSTKTDGILAEVWESKDALSASYGHDLAAMCKALYAEQAKRPTDFVNLGGKRLAEQGVDDQPTAAVESND